MEGPVDLFLKSLSANRGASAHTLLAYRSDLAAVRSFMTAQGLGQWERVGVGEVRAYVAHAIGAGLGAASLSRRLSALRSFYAHGCRQGWFKANPALGVRGPKKPRRLPRALDEAEVKRLVRAAASLLAVRTARGNKPDTLRRRALRVQALVEVLYGGGLRAGEALELDWADVDFDGGFVQVRGKGGKERVIPLGKPAQKALADYRYACGNPPGRSPVFLSKSG